MNGLLELNFSTFVREYIRHKPKERMDTILEPMQVMIQLALLAFCPIGTKISVTNNVLLLQWPSLSQGILRWFNKDSKEDLYFLFNVFRRYYKWYNNDKIFKYIITLSKRGLNNLIKTYERSDMFSITQTLSMYKVMFEVEDNKMFMDEEQGMDNVFKEIVEVYDPKIMKIIYNILKLMEMEENREYIERYYVGLQEILIPIQERIRVWITERLTV